MIAIDRTSKEIADELGISYRTVDNHRTNISAKLNLRQPQPAEVRLTTNRACRIEVETRSESSARGERGERIPELLVVSYVPTGQSR